MLKAEHLTIRFGDIPVVKDLSFSMEPGEILGIVGESGSGKTMTALSIMGLLPGEASVEGEILLNGRELTGLSGKERSVYAGKEIGMVFQEPMTSLNPVMKIGKQLEEMLILHTSYSKSERLERINDILETVELSGSDLYNKYPHQLSGGMQQRVMIAMAVICNPGLLIADEPTTALDVQIQAQVLQLLKKINKERNTGILFISHDLHVIKEICSRVIVMQGGVQAETGTVQEIFNHPQDAYTKKLISSIASGHKQVIINKDEHILELKDVTVYYTQKSRTVFGKKTRKNVVENLSFSIKKGEILGIAGRSGIGKTSLSKAILGLHKEYEGSIIHYSERPQMIFQDSYSSLNPAKSVGWILEEPLRIQRKYSKEERKKAAADMLGKVGLAAQLAKRRPSELSGGQRQRVSIALSLMLGSRFIIADEPVSALDVTVQSQILDLLLELQKEFQLSILFISHDINVMDKVCDRIIKL